MLTWEQFEREQDLAEEPDTEVICPAHQEKFPSRGFCGACLIAELKEVDELLKENPD